MRYQDSIKRNTTFSHRHHRPTARYMLALPPPPVEMLQPEGRSALQIQGRLREVHHHRCSPLPSFQEPSLVVAATS